MSDLRRSRGTGSISRLTAALLIGLMLVSGTLLVAQPDAFAKDKENQRLNRREKKEGYGSSGYRQGQTDQGQSGQGQGADDGRSDFDLRIRKDVLDGEVDGQGLMSGAAQQNFSGKVDDSGLKMQQGVFGSMPLSGSATSFAPLIGGITKVEIQRLEEHDLVLVIDRSLSMNNVDCPAPAGLGRALGMGMISRWDWCREQTRALAGVTATYNRGIKLLMFSRNIETFPDVRINQVPGLFQRYAPNPASGTNLAEPLVAVLKDYMARRDSGRNVRPLAIAVVFDGLTRKGTLDYLENTIIDATKRMRDPNEIKITIFLVGHRGPRVLQRTFDLQENLVRHGARYNIVRVVPFENVQRTGLARSLAQTLQPTK